MSVEIIERTFPKELSNTETRWRDIPPAIAVDIDPAACEIDPAIRLLPGSIPTKRLFGRSLTVQCYPPDFGAVLRAADMIEPGDVLVIAAGGNSDTAMIGEVVSGVVRRRGGAGVICDGALRDTGELASWNGFAVFTRHITPRGPSSAETGSVNQPVDFAGTTINPGDLILGDADGLARLTPEMVESFIEPAEAKIKLEKSWLERFANDESIKDVFGL